MDPVMQTFMEVLEVPAERLSDESSPDNTPEWDSMKAMELVAALEDNFEVEFSTMEIYKMNTIGVVREVLKQKGVEGV